MKFQRCVLDSRKKCVFNDQCWAVGVTNLHKTASIEDGRLISWARLLQTRLCIFVNAVLALFVPYDSE